MSLSPALHSNTSKTPHFDPSRTLSEAITASQNYIFSQWHKDGYWWYTLEANDSINAEYIMLLKYLGLQDRETEQAISRWILSNQNSDGSWSVFYKGPSDLSTTVECYMALKMAGISADHEQMLKAKNFILENGGITKIRIFSRIHLALFGLVDWNICPNMPVALMQMPEWTPVNIYEFSSWARACIVPLLVIMDIKKTIYLDGFSIDELYVESDPKKARWTYDHVSSALSLENAFVQMDKALKVADRLKLKPLRKASLKKCESYIREHVETTEDIFPAMFYGVLALNALGYSLTDRSVEKAMLGLKSFQIIMSHNVIDEVPFLDHSTIDYNVVYKDTTKPTDDHTVYQQCCISPVWDTAWAGVALMDSDVSPSDPRLIKTAEWLLSKQILDVVGDWSIKNPGVEPGGWSFEFHNKHYPDLDDTIEVLTYLHCIDLPYRRLKKPIERGLKWLLSMKCKTNGFAAFDKDNDFEILNKIPFSDHGACLDPSTVDITGRVINFLTTVIESDTNDVLIQNAADFIAERQERDGSFWGRWGVAYIYGTWCALEGLGCLKRKKDELVISRALHWLKSIQNPDGGFGESCDSYKDNRYLALGESTPSQTAWALMGFVGAGQAHCEEAKRAADYLIQTQTASGTWDEKHFTGTGFPGHFYIRYHGYRNYFPLMALGKYRRAISG